MRIALSSFLTLAVVAIAAPAHAQPANPLPAGDGRDIVSVACSQCHYLGTIAKIRDGAARLARSTSTTWCCAARN